MSHLITLLIFLAILGLIVLIHEFGHFITAKLNKVYVHEFSLGFGPKLFSFKRKNDETEYMIKALPLGGYVMLAGETDDDDKKVPENQKTMNTRVSGTIALYLFEKISASKEFQYNIKKDYIGKLEDVLLNSAWKIKDELSNIFQIVINGIKDEEETYPFGRRRRKPDAPKMYITFFAMFYLLYSIRNSVPTELCFSVPSNRNP